MLHCIFYFIPISYALVWIFAGKLPEAWINKHDFLITGGITPLMSLLGFITSMIKGSVIMLGVWTLKELFGYYEQKVFFSKETVLCFKQLSHYLIWWVIAGILSEPLQTIILTMNNPEGQKAVAISFQSADLTALILGGVLSVIAKVMESGRKLQEESELTI